MGAWQPRQQAVKSSDGVSDKLGFRSEAGQFWECSALERNAMQRKISGATKSWSVSRIMLTSCIGRSLAMLMLLPAAIGNASRRIAVSCPCEASRANNFLAGRSLAAILFCRTPERDQREPERSDGSSRARSGATRFPLATCGTRPVSSGLASFRPSERNDSAPPSLAVAAVKWSGRKAGESGQAAGGSVPILGARHAAQVAAR